MKFRILAVPALLAFLIMAPASAGAQSSGSCPSFTYNLYLGMTDAQSGGQVSLLQDELGGEVTGYFGPVTERLLQAWQARNGIIASGNRYTTGYGALGPRTRALLSSLCATGSNATTTSPSVSTTSPSTGPGATSANVYAEFVASDVSVVDVDGGEDYAEFEVTLQLTADDSDIYVSMETLTEDATLGSVGANTGWNYDVTGATKAAAALTSTAPVAESGTIYRIKEGETEEFTVSATALLASSGEMRLKLGAIQYGTSASNVFAKTLYVNENEFRTPLAKQPTNNASCKIWTSKEEVASGEKYTISWTTQGISDPWMNQIAKAGGQVRIEKKGSMSWQAPLTSVTAGYEEFKIGEGASGSIKNALCTTVVKVLPDPATEPKVSFSAAPSTIVQGQSATLTWSSKNANRCLLQDGRTEEKIALSGKKTVSPLQTTKYQLSCTNDPGTGKDGPTAFASATVAVQAASTTPSVPSVTIPKSTYATKSPTLTGTAKNLETFTLVMTGIQDKYADVVFVKNGTWSHKVSIELPNGTYGLEAYDPKGTLLGSGVFRVEVPVTPTTSAPTCSVTASNDVITPGQSTKLTWSSKNATYGEGPFGDKIAASGTLAYAPTTSTTYNFTFYGAGGQKTCSTRVIVEAAPVAPATPTVQISALPTSVIAGQAATLSWKTANAMRCVLFYGTAQESVSTSGSRTFYPYQATTYRLWCANDPGTGKDGPSAESSATVNVTQDRYQPEYPTLEQAAAPKKENLASVISGFFGSMFGGK